jgi:hypothetical protein
MRRLTIGIAFVLFALSNAAILPRSGIVDSPPHPDVIFDAIRPLPPSWAR